MWNDYHTLRVDFGAWHEHLSLTIKYSIAKALTTPFMATYPTATFMLMQPPKHYFFYHKIQSPNLAFSIENFSYNAFIISLRIASIKIQP